MAARRRFSVRPKMAMRMRHRDERELPEGVVEEEVERDEDAEHRDLLEQEEGVEDSFVRFSMAFQETSTPSGARKPVRTTSHIERPSTPRW